MKTSNTNFFQALNQDLLNKLTTEVKETVATNVRVVSTKTFTAVDLWKIQRTQRTAARRRIFA